MPETYQLIEDVLGYITNEDESKTSPKHMIAESQNTFIDREKKVGIRAGFSFALETGEDTSPALNGWTWPTSTSLDIPIRFNVNNNLLAYFGTVDGTILNSWYTIFTTLDGTYPLRKAYYFDATEKIDFMLMVNHSANVFKWNGAIAIVDSVPDGTHVTKTGSTSWAGNRFYTSGNKVMFCVRTGIEYTYTGGETGTNLTVVDSTGLIAGDILIQKIVTQANVPTAGFVNDNIFSFNNNVLYASDTDERVFMAKNTDYTNITPSSPRAAGEATTLTLDDPSAKFGVVGKQLVVFAGDDAYIIGFEQITVGTGIAETVTVNKRSFGTNQGVFSQETLIQVDDSIVFLSREPALRLLESLDQINQRQLKSLSNPIKPDFDSEDWTNAVGAWHGSRVWMHSRVNSRSYILEWVEDASGAVRRYWQPPQIFPIGAFAVISGYLYGFSSGDGKSLLLLDGVSDYVWNSSSNLAEKVPVNAIAKFAYNPFGKRGNLKNLDEIFIEGQISQNTNALAVTAYYDYGGATQINEQFIDGAITSILLETELAASLGQQSLGHAPLGGAISSTIENAHFITILEYAKEDFYTLAIKLQTNDIDQQWSVLAFGPNTKLSARISR